MGSIQAVTKYSPVLLPTNSFEEAFGGFFHRHPIGNFMKPPKTGCFCHRTALWDSKDSFFGMRSNRNPTKTGVLSSNPMGWLWAFFIDSIPRNAHSLTMLEKQIPISHRRPKRGALGSPFIAGSSGSGIASSQVRVAETREGKSRS